MEATVSAYSEFSLDWRLFLEYIKVLIWPLIVVFLSIKFNQEIKGLLNRIKGGELPGGFKFDSPPPQDEKQIESKPKTQEIKEQYKIRVKEQEENIEKIKTDLVYTQIYLDFERIYRVIFGSQIDLLKRLRTNSQLGEAKNNTIFFFGLTQRVFPILGTWTFDLYMSFLLNNGLVLYSNDSYFITDKGRAFLAYIEYLNFPMKNL